MKCIRMLSVVFALWMLGGCGGASTVPSGSEAAAPAVLRVDGNQVVDANGAPVRLRGVAFGNQVWLNRPYPRLHHNEQDYARLRAMGMNAVRFYMHYNTFENDDKPGEYKAEGWQWLDDNIAWAKKNGVYLVLNMHVPPGGYQSLGEGKALWDAPSAQDRFIALWRAIAERYRNEPTIAGYDLLNEPVVTKSKDQWQALAERTIAAVREVDPDHILFIERVNAVEGDWKEDEERNFFLVNDKNVVYEFHFYKPFHYSHQGAPWVDFAAEDIAYPDPERVSVEWFLLDWKTGSFEDPKLPAGDSDWTYYEGAPFKVTDPSFAVGQPVLACGRNSGKAYFDDLLLEELNEDGSVKRELRRIPLTTRRGWFYWTENGSGAGGDAAPGREDEKSLSISGSTAEANLSAEIFRFLPEQGATYRISGWMKGENIPETAVCQIRMDFYSSRVPVHPLDKAFLAQELDTYVAWGKTHNVPLFLGEFGVIRAAFENDRGGVRWVKDMLDLIEERNLHFTYHDYHEQSFGLYFGDDTLPDPENANTPLIELFTLELNQ